MSTLDERLPEHLDVLCRERLRLEHFELCDLAEDAERGLEIGILEDAEVLPRAHHCEEALDSTALVLDDLVDRLEVRGGLVEVLARNRREPEEPDIGDRRRKEPPAGKMPVDVSTSFEQPTAALRGAGRAIPQLGFGVFQIRPGDETRAAVTSALVAGYRHVDTAAIYRNEPDVGTAIRASGLPAGSVWLTTKLANADQGAATARRAFEGSLRRLGFDAVDLYLLHWPHERRLESWRVLEQLHAEGLARTIGVSNFLVRHLDELLASASVPPAVNQIELSPFLYRSREDTLRRCADAGIVVEAYSPLTKGRRLDDSTVSTIADEVGRTPAQVLIRWSLQKGFVVLPRSSNPHRIAENAAVFDFALEDGQMARLDALDEGLTTGWDPAHQP